MHNTTQDLYALTNEYPEGVLFDDLTLLDAQRYRWLVSQLRAGTLVLHTETLGRLTLWADGSSFEAKVDQAIRTQKAVEALSMAIYFDPLAALDLLSACWICSGEAVEPLQKSRTKPESTEIRQVSITTDTMVFLLSL